MSTLDYASIASRYGVNWEAVVGSARFVVPRPYGLPSWIQGTDAFAPIAIVACLMIRLIPLKRKPRAVIELDAEAFTITESYDGLENSSKQSGPRREITELRTNRYANAVLLRIAGKENCDLPTKLPAPLVQWIGSTLEEALKHPGV